MTKVAIPAGIHGEAVRILSKIKASKKSSADNTKGHKAKQKIANTVARPFMSLTKNQRRAIVAGALVAYGGYKLYQYRDLISEGKSASSNWNPSSSIKLNTFEPERFKPDTFEPDRFEPDRFKPNRFKTSSELAMVRKKINDTESLFLDELGAIRNTNRKGSEFLVKMAAHLRELDEAKQGDVSKYDISKLILKAREYYSKMPETDENEFLHRTVLHDIANLLKDT